MDRDTAAELDKAEARRLRGTRSRAVEDVRPVLQKADSSASTVLQRCAEDEIFLEDIL